MDYKEKYLSWTENIYIDDADKLDLKNIFDDEHEIKERFYKDLEFGTGGLRGIIGIGTNRINKYVIREISQGLADFINKSQVKNKSVAIAYDSRLYSQEFAKETALVLNANGIKSYLFDELHPTPVLSFAVRYLNCCAGVVITASHNPKEYNGYKVYGEDGGQVVSPVDKEIVDCVNKITDFNQIKLMSEDEALEKGLLNLIGKEIDDEYIKKIKEQRINLDLKHDLKIVYTPLNGAGNKLVQRILKESGFENVYVVKEQESPDPSFKTIGIPNPENPKAFDLALKLAKEKNADIILATDPDSDRIGVAVKNKNDEYKFLTGNMTGVLLLEYILSQKKKLNKMPVNPVIISTIVSSRMAKLIALDYHAEYIDVLTGFKYIAQEIKKFEKDKNFVFGFEESYGCLIGTHARDKDAVIAAMLICEMADYYKEKNLNLLVALDNIYKKYGYHREKLESMELKGFDGLEKIKKIMSCLRKNKLKEINGLKIKSFSDYKLGIKKFFDGKVVELKLPKSDVIYFEFEDDSWICVRPSGTEPKLKIYFGAVGKNLIDADKKLDSLSKSFLSEIKNYDLQGCLV